MSVHKPIHMQTSGAPRQPSPTPRGVALLIPLGAPVVVDQPSPVRGLSELFVLGAGLPGCPSPATGRSSLPTTVACWGRKPVCRRVRCREVTRCAGWCCLACAPPGRRAGSPCSAHAEAQATRRPRRRDAKLARGDSGREPIPLRSPPRVGFAKRGGLYAKTTTGRRTFPIPLGPCA